MFNLIQDTNYTSKDDRLYLGENKANYLFDVSIDENNNAITTENSGLYLFDVDNYKPSTYVADVADIVKGEADTYYIADIDGISIYSKANGKQLIHKNNRSDVNQYSDFYDIAAINDDTIIVHSWNEKSEAEQLVKYKITK